MPGMTPAPILPSIALMYADSAPPAQMFPSNTPAPTYRARAPRPPAVCRDFQAGNCNSGGTCKFPQIQVDQGMKKGVICCIM